VVFLVLEFYPEISSGFLACCVAPIGLSIDLQSFLWFHLSGSLVSRFMVPLLIPPGAAFFSALSGLVGGVVLYKAHL
jgi:hypothetical protein